MIRIRAMRKVEQLHTNDLDTVLGPAGSLQLFDRLFNAAVRVLLDLLRVVGVPSENLQVRKAGR